jgi:hypothetical protein
MKRVISGAFAAALLISACSGDLMKIGETGEAGATGAGAGNGQAGSGGSGACQGLPCGAACSRCGGDGTDCVTEYCDAQGECGPEFPECEAPQCEATEDCVQPAAPCEKCSDGSLACPTVECFAGQCVGSFPTCTDKQCNSDQDCPQLGAPCQVCADGSAACPFNRCENGSCVSGIDRCPDSEPCEGKACGDFCNTCAPGQSCPPVAMYCDENQECQNNAPVCDGCVTDDDCPGVGACPMCPDGMSCAELRCVEGACKFQCEPAGSCGDQGDSCANGETCCGGLECCSGVPVPAGEEYCGAICPISDRNIKRDFASVDQTEILEKVARLPISTWAYKTEEGTARHLGPMAQDFKEAFQLGASDKTILQVDADGVALAAIQALHARLERLEQRNAELERELQVLKAR